MAVLDPIERHDLVEDVCLRIRRAIFAGGLAAGERLVEDQLATRLGVSRAPVRDALHSLERDGLVTSSGRRGKVVATLRATDAWEVYSLRASLEAMAIRLAIARRRDALVPELERIVDQMGLAVRSHAQSQISSLDVLFHETICRASGHQRLFQSWQGMALQIRMLSHRVIDTQYADMAPVPTRHRALVDCIRSGDEAAAEAAIRQHIDSVGRRVIGVMEAHDSQRIVADRVFHGQAGSAVLGELGSVDPR